MDATEQMTATDIIRQRNGNDEARRITQMILQPQINRALAILMRYWQMNGK